MAPSKVTSPWPFLDAPPGVYPLLDGRLEVLSGNLLHGCKMSKLLSLKAQEEGGSSKRAYWESWSGSTQYHTGSVRSKAPTRGQGTLMLHCLKKSSSLFCSIWSFLFGETFVSLQIQCVPQGSSDMMKKNLFFQWWMEEWRSLLIVLPWWGPINHWPFILGCFFSIKKASNRGAQGLISRKW